MGEFEPPHVDEMEHIDFDEEDAYEESDSSGTITHAVQQHIHKNIDERPDSIEIGTPSKGGAVKIYFNADDSKETTEERIVKAFAARKFVQEQAKLQEEIK